MKAAGIPHEKRRPPSVGRRRPRGLVAKARSRVFSIDGCVNDAVGRRTSMSRSGSAYANPDTIAYTYNNRSELTGALSNVDTTYSYSYAYDSIGNRITASEAGVPWTYTTNNLNQYTTATENNTQLSFAYDLDGNMTYRPVDATSGWTQVWNCENRMVETTKGTDRLTFKYDYMGRRVEKCMYSNNTLTSKTLFVYDGFKCVEELDGLDGNAVLKRHNWQPSGIELDIVLATTDVSETSYFFHDVNKNVMQKTSSTGQIQENYIYAPFGGFVGFNEAHIGFSSEITDNDTKMVYYNYRYLAIEVGRWNKRDSIEEKGGNNLYNFVYNSPILKLDELGEKFIEEYKMSKCEIVIFYGHNYFNNDQFGIQNVKIIPIECSYYTLLGCRTSSLNNPTPLPHFQPPKDIIGWYRDKDDSKGLSDYVREAKEAAQKAAINLKKCPCNCDSVSIKVIRVDKEFPWFLFDPSYEEQIDIGRTN